MATFLLGLFLASSCRWGVDMEACYRLQDGDWRGLLTTEVGDLPFLFRVEREAGPQKSKPSDRSFKVRLQDGETWVESVAEVRGDSLYWPFPVFESVLVAAVSTEWYSRTRIVFGLEPIPVQRIAQGAHHGHQHGFKNRKGPIQAIPTNLRHRFHPRFAVLEPYLEAAV
ncbi:MAG: hypothetical protein ACKOFE_01285, partial [Bacteroidota bacterium]